MGKVFWRILLLTKAEGKNEHALLGLINLFKTKKDFFDDFINIFDYGNSTFKNEDIETVIAHKYDTVRKLKHELIFVIDWNYLIYHYELKQYAID